MQIFLFLNNKIINKVERRLIIAILFLSVIDSLYAFEDLTLPKVPTIPSEPTVILGGNVYYVNKDIGSDLFTTKQAKEKETPWATVQKGVRKLKAGDTLVVVKSSKSYYERVNVNVAGTEDAWINIVGSEDERPVIKGFVLHEKSRYVRLNNFILEPETAGVYLKRGVESFFIENIVINGKGTAKYGLKFGSDIIDNHGVKKGYVNNIEVHHTVNYGVYIENGAEDIVFNNVISHHSLKDDGFAGRSNTSEKDSPTRNLYFINSEAHHNARDGFDIGAGVNQVFINCLSHNNGLVEQGVGFKVWGGIEDGGNIFLINNVAYKNSKPALVVKNISDVNVNLYHNTFVGNGVNGGGVEIMTVNYNRGSGGFAMGIPKFYIFNNFIFSKGTRSVFSFYNPDSEVVKSGCNYVVSLVDVPYCRVRDKEMKVTGQVMISKNMKSDVYSDRCQWVEKNSQIHVINNINKLKIVDLDNNNYMLNKNSPLIGKGCNIGIAFDVDYMPRNLSAPDIGAHEHKLTTN